MATTAGVGKSNRANAFDAGRDAAAQACGHLDGTPPSFCFVFGTTGYDQGALLAGVRSVSGAARLAGCSGEGVIAGDDSEETDRAVAVLAVHSTNLRFDPVRVDGFAQDPGACARSLAAELAGRIPPDALAVLVFVDGLVGNCTDFLNELSAVLPAKLPVVGGAAGDALEFDRTFQYLDGDAASHAVSAVVISGTGRFLVRLSHGCEAMGLALRITAADSGWIREIDGRRAWDVYKEFLDGDPKDLNAEGIAHLCLASGLDGGDTPFVLRAPLQLDHTTGALFFPGGGLAVGSIVRIARRDPERIRDTSCSAAMELRMAGGTAPALVFQFDCAGRGRLIFGPQAAEYIVRPQRRIVGSAVPWIGFHTYGEIAPSGEATSYHNYTVALCALFDGAD